MAGTHEAVAVLGIGAKGMGWQLARCAHDRTAGSLMPGLADGLVWAAPQPDAIMVQLPDRAGRWPASRPPRCCAAGTPPRSGQEGTS